MKKTVVLLSGLLLAGALLLTLWPRRAPNSAAVPLPTAPSKSARTSVAARALRPPPIQSTAPQTDPVRTKESATGTTVSQFRNWSERYAKAGAGERAMMLKDGASLASERRAMMSELIEKNPAEALRLAVPYEIRKTLPPEILALLETPVNGRADYTVQRLYPLPGQVLEKSTFRQVSMDGQSYDAFVYGSRNLQPSGRGVVIWGVALDGKLAVAESPLRILGKVEAKDLQQAGKVPADPICSVSGKPSVSKNQETLADFGGQIIAFCGTSHAGSYARTLAKSVAKDGYNALGGGGSGWTSSLPSYTQGTKTILYMRLVFPDDPIEPVSEEGAYQDLDDLNNFFVKSSYHMFSIYGTVTVPLMMPYPKKWYEIPAPTPPLVTASTPPNVFTLYPQAQAAAAALGYNFSDYDWTCIRFSSIKGVGWGGLQAGSSIYLISGGYGVMAHEFGHELGLAHANVWDTSISSKAGSPVAAPGSPVETTSAIGHETTIGAGKSIEYADMFSAMGASAAYPYNMRQKWRLGWMFEEGVHLVDSATNSNVRLYSMDADTVVSGKKYAIRVRRSGDREYWLQYRTGVPGNTYLTNGVQVLWSGNAQTAGETDILDMTPNSPAGRADSPLAVGRTFHDPEINLFITPTGVGGVSSNSYIDVVVNIGTFLTNLPPSFVSLNSDSNNINPGDTVTFTATVTDPNLDPLAYAWTFDDNGVAPSTNIVSHKFTAVGEYVVRCVASDMKGGTASKSMVITVGNPTTYRIGGLIRTSAFVPVADVRVDNGKTGAAYRYGFTDTDGTYVIAGNPNGTYTVGAWKPGQHLEPFNTSIPITIADDHDLAVDWTATATTTVWISGIANATEGGNATVTLTRSGPLDKDLPVLFRTPFDNTITVNTATVVSDFTQTNGVTVTRTNALPVANEGKWDYQQITFPVFVNTLTLTFPTIIDGTFEGPEVFYVDLVDEIQRYFIYNYIDPVLGLKTATNDLRIPSWWQNFQPTFNLPPGNPNNNPSYLSFLPTNTYVQVDPGYIIGPPAMDWPATTIFDANAQALPTVSVVATGNTAMESGNGPGEYTFTVSQVLTNALTVFYTMSGTASNGQDYVFLPGSFVIPAGVRTYRYPVFAINNYFVTGPETAILTITPNPATYIKAGSAATVNIVDDDLPAVSLFSLKKTTTKSGGAATFSVTRTGNLERSLTVNYLVSGTATSGVDFNTLPGSVTIAAGLTTAAVNVVPIPDALVEGDETVVITLTGSAFYNIGFPNVVTITIQDDQLPTITVAGTGDATEGGANGQFTITRTGSTTNSVKVFYSVSGSAVPGVGADYNSIGTSVTIPIGASTVTIPVIARNDGFYEDTETVVLTLVTNATYNLGTPNQATINVLDSNPNANGAVGFFTASASGSESVTSVSLPVLLTKLPTQISYPSAAQVPNGSPAILKVDYGVSGGNATNGIDFFLASGTLIWTNILETAPNPANPIQSDLVQNITFTVNNDLLVNGNRSFVVTLSNHVENVFVGPTHQYLSRAVAAGNAEDASFNIGFGPNNVVNSLFVGPTNDVYVGGTFSLINLTNQVRVGHIRADGLVETNSFFFKGANSNILAIAQQTNGANAGKFIIAGLFTNTITSIGPPSTINFNYKRLARLNADGSLDTTFANGGITVDFDIRAVAVDANDNIYIGGGFTNVTSLSGPSSSQRFFTRLTPNGAIDAGMTNALGPDGVVRAILVRTNGSNKVVIGGDFGKFNTVDATRIVQLNFDGSIDASFTAAGAAADDKVFGIVHAYSPSYGPNSILVVGAFAKLNGIDAHHIGVLNAGGSYNGGFLTTGFQAGTDGTINSAAVQSDGHVVIGGAFNNIGDVIAPGSPVNAPNLVRLNANGTYNASMPTFPDNRIPQAAVNVVKVDSLDRIYFGGDFLPTVTPYPNNYAFDIYRNHTYTILDDDVSVIQITSNPGVKPQAQSSAVEGGQNGAFVIYSAATAISPITVNFGVSGSAARGSVYVLKTNGVVLTGNSVTIPSGTNQVVVVAEPIVDGVVELNATVKITLISTPAGQIGGSSSAIVTIADTDGFLQFEFATYRALENTGVVPITLRRNGSNTNSLVTVDYLISDGTAVNGVDYLGTNGAVTFFPGQLTANFNITIVNNNIVDGNRTVNLALVNPTGGVPLSGQNTATLIIVDEDTVFQFAVTNFVTTELSTNGVVTIYRTGQLTNTDTVKFTATNGTAIHGVDFTGVTNTVTFAPGVTKMTQLVPILDNTNITGDHTVTLRLQNPSGTTSLGISNIVATLTIRDDEAQFTFATNQYSIIEHGGFIVLTVNRVGGTINPVTVNFKTLNGTAFAGVNYFTNSGTLTFTGDVIGPASDDSGLVVLVPGETSKTISISIIDNQIGASNQIFSVNLSAPVGGPLAGSTTLGTYPSATVTILDDEHPGNVVFEYAVGTGANGSVVALGRQSDGRVIIGGQFTTANNISFNRIARLQTNGLVDGSFIVGAGANSNVTALAVQSGDKIYVAGAFTTFDLTSRAGIARLNADGSLDNTFDPGTGASDEVRAIQVLANGQVIIGGDFTNYNGATVARLARLNSDGSLDSTYKSTANASIYSLALQTDGKLLLAGSFTNVNGTNVNRIARLNADGTFDNTFVGAGTDQTILSLALQTDGKILIGGAFNLADGAARNFLARLQTDGTIDPGFNPGTGPNANVNSVGVDPNGKILIGGDFTSYNGVGHNYLARIKSNGQADTFFDVGTGPNAPVRAVLVQADTSVVIAGDFTSVNGLARNRVALIYGDEATNLSFMEFAGASFVADENASSATITFVRYGATNTLASFSFFTTDGSATAGTHYTTVSNSVPFPVGARTTTALVPLTDDGLPNSPRTVNLYMTNAVGGFLDTITNALLTINDNDVQFSFAAAGVSVSEAQGTVDIGILRSGSTNRAASVYFLASDNTAFSPSDYIGQTNTLVNFAVGQISNFVTVTIVNDTVIESTELVNLTLVDTLTNGLNVLPTTGISLTILDDDSTLQLAATTASVVEGSGSVTLTVTRIGSTNNTVTVRYSTVNQTAVAGSDFTGASSALLTFGPAVTSQSIVIPILNNKTPESDETFLVTLSSPGGGAILGATTSAQVTIIDDDSAFTIANASVAESAGNVTLTVSRNFSSPGGTNNTATVNFTTAPGTALAGTHYTTTSGLLTFGPGVLSQPITVPIINNTTTNVNRAFTVNLSTPGGESSLGSPNSATVTIVDDDSALQFNVSAVSVLEGSGSLSLNVTRTGNLSSTVSVPIFFTNGTATNGVDYLGTNTTLVFGPSVTNQVIVIGLINNTVVQSSRSFTANLGTPVGEASLVGNTVVTVTILDDDSELQFASTTLSALETAGSLPVVITRTGYTSNSVSVTLTSLDITAINGVHYTAVNSNLVFAAGQTSKTINVPIIDDPSIEGTGTFRMDLTNAVGEASVGAQSGVVVTVLAVNDAPTLAALSSFTINEDAGLQTVNLSGITSGPAGESAQTLTVTATSSNLGVIPNPTVNYNQNSHDATGTLTFIPVANAFGTATIKVVVKDNGTRVNGGIDSVTNTFVVTVLSVNDAPTMTPLLPLTINEDSGLQTVVMTGISVGPANEAGQTLAITATSDNPGLIPNPTVGYTNVNTTGTLTFTPVTNQSGSATITVVLTDNGGLANGGVNAFTNTFLVAVNPVNDRPTLNSIASFTILEDAGLQTVNLSGITAGGDGGVLTVTATSDNPGLIPNPIVGYTNANTTGKLTFTPVPNSNGVATIAVVVNDGGGTAFGGIEAVTNYFTVTVTPVNDIPTLDPLNPLTVLEDAGPQDVILTGISAGFPNESDQTLTVAAITSNNRNLVPDPTVVYTPGATTATLTYTPRANEFGVAVITVTVKDNGGTANGGVDVLTQSFTVTVISVNDAPTLAALPPLTINEDAGQQTVNLSGITTGPSNEAGQVLTITAYSDNTALIPNPTVNYNSPQTNGNLKFTPATNANGTATIKVIVTDNGGTANGGVNAVTNTFLVTVNPVNDAPTLDALAPLTINEDAGLQIVGLTGIGAGAADEIGQTFTVTAMSSSPGVIPNPTVNYNQNSSDATGTLSFTPAANANGTVTIKVVVTDNGGTAIGGKNAVTNLLVVTINPVNDAPGFTPLANLKISEGAGLQTVNLTNISAGPPDEANQGLVITATSSNSSIVSDPLVSYLSPQTSGSLSFTPVANANGTVTITVIITDSGGTANGGVDSYTNSFDVVISPVNNPPTLDALANVTINEDSGATVVSLSGISPGPANEGAQTLTITATSSDLSIIPNPVVALPTSPQATNSLSFTPVLNASGTVTIKVVVTDNGQSGSPLTNDFKSVTNTFTVTVNPRNDAPTLTAIPNPLAILEDAGQQTINLVGLSAGPANETGQTLTLTATSSDPSLIPNPTVNYTSPNATGSLTYTPVANANGTATIKVIVRDNGGTANGGVDAVTNTFVVTVTAVNDAPTLGALANLTLNEDPGVQTVNLGGISAGPANESGQVLTITATSSDTSVVPHPTVTYTSPQATGGLSFTPVLNASGTATIQVVVRDNGGTANGGVDAVTNVFTVTINSVNDAPTLAAIPNPLAILEDAGQQTVNLTGISSGAANETQTLILTATSSNPALIPNPTVNYTSANTTGSLTYTPVTNANGTATIKVIVQDNGGTANGGVDAVTNTFVVTVTAVNDAPMLNALANLNINEDPGVQTVNLTGISTGAANETQGLTITATSDNPAVVPHPTVSYTSPNPTGSLSFTPVLNAYGTATIQVVVRDDGGTANGGVDAVTNTFTITVNSVNDAPTLDPISNLILNEDAGTQTINLTGIGTGTPNEVQTLTITATSSTPSLIPDPVITYTSPNAAGTLTFTPVTNGNGIATITVTVKDNGGTANGGSDTSTRLFLVTILPVNDAPVLTHIPDKIINQGSLLTYTNTATDVEGDRLTFSLVGSPPAGVNLTPAGIFTWTPAANQSPGTNAITVRVTDNGQSGSPLTNDFKSASQVFTVVVNPTNTPPRLNQQTVVNGDYQFTLVGEAGKTYRVEYTTDLLTWILLYTVVNPDGEIHIVDPGVTARQLRFYRIVRVQ